MEVANKKKRVSIRAKVQAIGGFLTNMVLPNIGAFIAWGIVTALFIPTGWFPNESLNELVSPTVSYLLPLLLAYTGGRMVGGTSGAVFRLFIERRSVTETKLKVSFIFDLFSTPLWLADF